jgi:hypothetical protein
MHSDCRRPKRTGERRNPGSAQRTRRAYALAHDPEKCARFSEEIMRKS